MVLYGFYGNTQFICNFLLLQFFKSAHFKDLSTLIRQLVNGSI